MAVISTKEAFWYESVPSKSVQIAMTGLYQEGARFKSQPERPITKNFFVLHIQSNTTIFHLVVCVIHKNSLLLNQHNGNDAPQN